MTEVHILSHPEAEVRRGQYEVSLQTSSCLHSHGQIEVNRVQFPHVPFTSLTQCAVKLELADIRGQLVIGTVELFTVEE